VKGVHRPVFGFVDRVGLADGVENNFAITAHRVDGQLGGSREGADDKIDLVFFDKL
jgi:hypothetical protein